MERPWRTGDIYQFKPDLKYTVWLMPVADSAGGWGMSISGDTPVIPKGAKNDQASFRWCCYLCGVDDREAYAILWTMGLRPHMPISKQATETSAFQKAFEMFPGFKMYTDDFFSSDWLAASPKLPVAECY